MTIEVLINHKNPIGACYLARTEDGVFLAGRSADCAKQYPDAQAVVDTFKPFADQGAHWAWNLCYFIEDYVA